MISIHELTDVVASVIVIVPARAEDGQVRGKSKRPLKKGERGGARGAGKLVPSAAPT